MTTATLPTTTSDPPASDGRVTRILGIAGSLRAGSYNQLLLRHAGMLLPAGSELARWEDLRSIPPFSEDDEETPNSAVLSLRAAISAADAVLVVTPEYNGSIPGQLKNALDWASRPFPDNVLRDKPVAVIGASPSPGGAARAQAEARIVLARIGARVLDGEVQVARAYQQFDQTGQMNDAQLQQGLTGLLGELVVAASEPRQAAA